MKLLNILFPRDEQKARELGLSPEDVKKIVDMSMEEFNVSHSTLNPSK